MNFSHPIYWHQGIFLQPQHFQYNDQFHATSYARLFGMARIQPYGIAALTISKERLSSGFLSCTSLQAVMPEGIWIDIRQNSRLPDRDIRTLVKENGRYRIVFAIPQITADFPAVATAAHDGRFESPGYPEVLPDLYNDSPDLAIDRLWFRGRYLIGGEIDLAKDMSIITIGYLVVENGTISLDPQYAPPCLQIGSYDLLKTQLNNLTDILQTRSVGLSKLSHPWRFDGEPVDPVWLRDRIVQADLSQALTELTQRIRANVEPAVLFEVLLVLAGRLCASGGLSFPDMPPWEAEDPLNSFKRIQEIVVALLEQLRSGPDSTAVFHHRGGWYEAQVPSAVRVGKFFAYLILQEVSETELLQVGPPKLAPLTHIETIVSRALPGVSVERLNRVPYGLGEGAGAMVWSIDVRDPLWLDANTSGTLCLNWLDLPKHARALIVYFRA
jgi:type VI secretion system protein ImpJ